MPCFTHRWVQCNATGTDFSVSNYTLLSLQTSGINIAKFNTRFKSAEKREIYP